MKQDFAILLCKFSDAGSDTPDRARIEQLFTTAGAGTGTLVDYFDDVSHGNADMSGNTVFGWLTLPKKKGEYVGSGLNPQGRQDLLDWAKQAAKDDGIDLTPYGGNRVVVITHPGVDAFGGGNGAVLSDDREPTFGFSGLCPSLAAQEMGHALGLNHSMMVGSMAQYQDPWDVMSTMSARTAPHPTIPDTGGRANGPVYPVGPGLNAANMAAMGWLEAGRTWTAQPEEYGVEVTLRPLHQRDLPGFLCARVGDYFVEFRVQEEWDAGLEAPMVLVHTLGSHPDISGECSWLQPADDGSTAWAVGDKLTRSNGDPLGASLAIEVSSIDAVGRTATIRVDRRVDRQPQLGVTDFMGGVRQDGGGWVIVGGKPVRIPPRSPLLDILTGIAGMRAVEEALPAGALRAAAYGDQMEQLATAVQRLAEKHTRFSEPDARHLSAPQR